ncbi:uncharacterized protein LOC143039299 [Oratosquilla oratoria]|uniref:uncharacterized protein LOC143039299 n=1 Tax=Oratosquilla oratoria TaxID=337810 RepID=UPI003F75B024
MAPVLAIPNHNLPLTGIGAVLMEQHDIKLRPIAYASRTLNKHKQHYSVTEIEALAIKYVHKLFKEIILAQKSDPFWKRNIYFLTFGDTTDIDGFRPKIDNYFLIDEVLYQTIILKNKHEPNRSVLQLVVPTEFIPAHPVKDKFLSHARLQYIWLTMRKEIHAHIDACHSCASHKGYIRGLVPILFDPVSSKLFDIVDIDLLKLPLTPSGNQYHFV